MPYVIETVFSFAGIEQGWSENFYWQQDTDDLQAAENTMLPIALARSKLLSKDYTLTIVRNGIVRNNAGEKVLRQTDLLEPRFRGVQSWESATPNLALMVSWQNANNTLAKRAYMRGIPAGLGDDGKHPNMSYGNFLSNFNAWRTKIIGLKAGWYATQQSAIAIINTYVLNADTGIVTFTLQAPGLTFPVANGFQTRVYVKWPGRTPIDGPLLVIPTAATSCFTAKPIGVGPASPGIIGTMTLRTPTLVTVAASGGTGSPTGNIHPLRIITHKTGRPSYASRGRQLATPKW